MLKAESNTARSSRQGGETLSRGDAHADLSCFLLYGFKTLTRPIRPHHHFRVSDSARDSSTHHITIKEQDYSFASSKSPRYVSFLAGNQSRCRPHPPPLSLAARTTSKQHVNPALPLQHRTVSHRTSPRSTPSCAHSMRPLSPASARSMAFPSHYVSPPQPAKSTSSPSLHFSMPIQATEQPFTKLPDLARIRTSSVS